MPYESDKLRRDKARVEAGIWDKLRRHIRRIPFVDEVLAGYYCAIDPATPLQAKAVLYGALAYFVLPFDLLPDVVALLGFTDDAAVIYAAIRVVSPHINDRHRAFARAAIERLAGDPAATRQA